MLSRVSSKIDRARAILEACWVNEELRQNDLYLLFGNRRRIERDQLPEEVIGPFRCMRANLLLPFSVCEVRIGIGRALAAATRVAGEVAGGDGGLNDQKRVAGNDGPVGRVCRASVLDDDVASAVYIDTSVGGCAAISFDAIVAA